jgi:exopolysaccharide biosynthesis polyprenyl glycosylphosphotransferase
MDESAVLSQVESVISQEPVDEVIVALPISRYGSLVDTIVRVCEEQGIIVRVSSEMFNLRIAKSQVDEIDGVPIVTIRSGPEESWQLGLKMLIDIIGSAALLIVLLPLFAVVALLIRLDSPGPAFFLQERVGLNKRRFRLIKFRTMCDGANHQQQLLEHLNEADGPVFKIRNDPRITRLGSFLRRYSIDELPQLFNVLKQDMSLVGPRPLPVRDVERIEKQGHKRRFSVKPGITCLWQINGRSDINFDHWARLDLEYIDSWSLGLDIRILLKTIPAVVKGSGAY